jgi:hypothetical protein
MDDHTDEPPEPNVPEPNVPPPQPERVPQPDEEEVKLPPAEKKPPMKAGGQARTA